MKQFIFLIVAFLYCNESISQNLIALKHNNSITYVQNLNTALFNAVDGDEIYLPGGLIPINNNVTINKKIKIYGAGYNPIYNQYTGVSVIDQMITFVAGSDSAEIIGIKSTEEFYFFDGGQATFITGLKFIRNQFKRVVMGTPTVLQGIDSILFEENIIDGDISNPTGMNFNAKFKNNIIAGEMNRIQNCMFKNNVFTGCDQYVLDKQNQNNLFENNIFLHPTFEFVNLQFNSYNLYNIFNSNLFVADSIILDNNMGSGSGNIFNEPVDSVFANYTLRNLWKPSYDFHLLPQCSGINLGTDGTDVGIYGSVNPFKENGLPDNPHFEFLQVNGFPTESGYLRYNVSINGQTQMLSLFRVWFDTDSTYLDFSLSNSNTTLDILDSISIAMLDTGFHNIHFQFKDTNQIWSSVVTRKFRVMGSARLDFATPNRGGDIGEVTLNAYGDGFYSDTQVYLTNVSDTIFPIDTLTNVFSGNWLQATFDLEGKPLGNYNIVVKVPFFNDTILLLQNAFEIVDGNYIPPLATITGPPAIRPSAWSYYNLSITNNGNVNTYGTMVYLTIPVDLEFEFNDNPILYSTTSLSYDTIVPYFLMDSLFGEPLNGVEKVYPLIIPSVAPGRPVNIPIRLKGVNDFCIGYTSSNSLYHLKRTQDRMNCLVSILDEAIGYVPGLGCVKTIYDEYTNPGIENCSVPELCQNAYINGVFSFANVIVDCTAKPLSVLAKIADYLEKANSIFTVGNDCYDALYPSYPLNCFNVQTLYSSDPNIKSGPIGLDSINNYVTNSILNYTIHFENDSAATGPAQYVLVVDSLNPLTYDLTSFSLNKIIIADSVISFPPFQHNGQTDIDLNLLGNVVSCRINYNLNQLSGKFECSFTSIDPNTLLPVSNPFVGFLPPNIQSPEGEGSISFTIKCKDSLTQNALIQNKANIYFDTNPPITTNNWSNKFDNMPPISQVNFLPSTQNDSLFNVSWNASDSGSGVLNYSIYYSVNGGDYILWKYNTFDTSATFVGNADSTYCFYSVAIDSALNIETAPFTPDACTSIILSTNSSLPSQVNFKLYPNPAQNRLTLELFSTYSQIAEVLVTDLIGQEVYKTLLPVVNGINLNVFSPKFSKGSYIFEIKTNEGSAKKILIKM